MKLIASLIVRDELGRYLRPCLESLVGFCDEVRVLDDGSTDGWADRLGFTSLQLDRLHVARSETSVFFDHEGRARNALLDWTLAGDPSHVLAIDADEFVSDGFALRARVERSQSTPVWSLNMEEVWQACDDVLCVRRDGGWRPHPVPILYRVPRGVAGDRSWRIRDEALACGREPIAVRQVGRIRRSGVSVLHFGWACQADRQARYDRYVEHDGGAFHAGKHLESIMWPDEQVSLGAREWPAGLNRALLLERANRQGGPDADDS